MRVVAGPAAHIELRPQKRFARTKDLKRNRHPKVQRRPDIRRLDNGEPPPKNRADVFVPLGKRFCDIVHFPVPIACPAGAFVASTSRMACLISNSHFDCSTFG